MLTSQNSRGQAAQDKQYLLNPYEEQRHTRWVFSPLLDALQLQINSASWHYALLVFSSSYKAAVTARVQWAIKSGQISVRPRAFCPVNINFFLYPGGHGRLLLCCCVVCKVHILTWAASPLHYTWATKQVKILSCPNILLYIIEKQLCRVFFLSASSSLSSILTSNFRVFLSVHLSHKRDLKYVSFQLSSEHKGIWQKKDTKIRNYKLWRKVIGLSHVRFLRDNCEPLFVPLKLDEIRWRYNTLLLFLCTKLKSMMEL